MRPTLVRSSIDRRVHFEESAGGTRVQLDFRSVAGLIDVVAGHDPRQLSTQLAVLWDSNFKEEARYVLTAALVCRDPLSDLGAICTDAFTTIHDLNRLVKRPDWSSLGSVLGHPDVHACALLNACEDRINEVSGTKQMAFRAIRTRLEQAATFERTARSADIAAMSGLRLARCPDLWPLFERYRDTK